MKANQATLHHHHSTLDRQSNILRIKSSLRSFPIISRNQTRIHKRMSMTELNNQDCSSDTQSVQNDEETNSSPFSIDHAELFSQKYELMEKLGEGSNGVVHRCLKRRTGQSYAVKSFMFDDEQLPELKANFLLLRSLSHPCIVKYEALYIDVLKHAGWLVMELVPATSLGKAELGGEEGVRHIFGQILDALAYLHRRAIAHRDIKMENILFDPELRKVKVIDFGICRKARRRGTRFDMWTITGTLYYRAPQMFAGGGYNQKVDIWSAGILLYKLITGKTPFQSEYHNKTIHNIQHKEIEFPEEFDQYSPELKQFVKRTLKRNPVERLTASQCLKDAWFIASPQKEELQEETEEDWEGLSPLELHKPTYHSYIREINGDQYHCIDSDEQNQSNSVKKKPVKSVSLQQVQFLI